MQLSTVSPIESPAAVMRPSRMVAERFQEHFAAFGVDEVVSTSPDQLTLKFDQQSGFEHAIASMAMKNAIDGVQLVFDLADGASVPRMLPDARYIVPTLQQLPGVTQVTLAETSPQRVTVFTDGRASASDAAALLNPTLPMGDTVSVTVSGVEPNE